MTTFPWNNHRVVQAGGVPGQLASVGKPVQSTILGLSRQLFLLIPLLLILPNFWGIEGVWRTPPIADVLSTLITGTVVYIEMKHIKERELLQKQGA